MKRAFLAAAPSAASRVSPPTLSQYLYKKSTTITTVEWVNNIHIDRTFLLEHLVCLCSFVVEGYICANFLHECDFLIRACRGNHFEAVALRQLDDETRRSWCMKEHLQMKKGRTYDPTAPAPVLMNATSPFRS